MGILSAVKWTSSSTIWAPYNACNHTPPPQKNKTKEKKYWNRIIIIQCHCHWTRKKQSSPFSSVFHSRWSRHSWKPRLYSPDIGLACKDTEREWVDNTTINNDSMTIVGGKQLIMQPPPRPQRAREWMRNLQIGTSVLASAAVSHHEGIISVRILVSHGTEFAYGADNEIMDWKGRVNSLKNRSIQLATAIEKVPVSLPT